MDKNGRQRQDRIKHREEQRLAWVSTAIQAVRVGSARKLDRSMAPKKGENDNEPQRSFFHLIDLREESVQASP